MLITKHRPAPLSSPKKNPFRIKDRLEDFSAEDKLPFHGAIPVSFFRMGRWGTNDATFFHPENGRPKVRPEASSFVFRTLAGVETMSCQQSRADSCMILDVPLVLCMLPNFDCIFYIFVVLSISWLVFAHCEICEGVCTGTE